MLPFASPQPRNYCVKLEATAGHRTQPWTGVTHGLAPAFQPPVYPFHQGVTIAMPETTATSRPWRVTAAPNMPCASTGVSPTQVPKPASVKHLTCYFWAKNGACKFSEEDCLYAHHDTGKVAQGPLQVELGRRCLSRPDHLLAVNRQLGPAVAGKNATAAKPIYQDWRGSAESFSHGSKSSRGTMTDPEIQEQLRYIALKAKANAMAYNSATMNVLPHKRRQSEATSPTDGFFRDSQRHRQSPSLASTDQLLENQMQVLATTTETLSTIIDRSMKAFDAAANALHVDVESLVDVYRAIVPAEDDGGHPAHIDKMSNALHRITRVALDLSEMACVLSNTRITMTKELDSAGLRDLAPVWQHLQN